MCIACSLILALSVGLWQYDIKEGPGKMVFSNGNVYDGLWKRDSFHGKVCEFRTHLTSSFSILSFQGILHCVHGAVERYDGDWENGKHQGKG